MQTPITPFESIGLCFSGGGYRATFFSLGVISYLNRIPFKNETLLNHVEALSSVSGGSLLAVAFARAVQSENYDFETFYHRFYESFTPGKDKLVENAVGKLESAEVWAKHPHKRPSLINAFALSYADMPIFQGEFGMFKKSRSSHLKHVCFNATEFSYGKAFRFQNVGVFGNGSLRCAEMNQISAKIPLADIVASSSCFPIGFEPLVFPDDYIRDRKDPQYKAIKRLPDFCHGLGVMDGGIVDNQGIGSMVNISNSKMRDKPLDLIIVNDVGSSDMQPWQAESTTDTSQMSIKEKIRSFLKYIKLHWLYLFVLFAGFVLMLINSLELIKDKAWPSLYITGGILTGIGLSVSMIGAIAGHVKTDIVRKIKTIFRKNVPASLLDEVKSFQRLDIDLVKRMIIERATSGAKMINNVFLKQIRYLNYELLYSSESLKNRRISSVIGELNGERKTNAEITAPKKQLKTVAMIASEAPTTLWWSEEDIKLDRMNSLIACGQFTTCYNLMKYILDLKKNGIDAEGMDEMYKALKKDWIAFNKDPMFMVDTRE
ncbi:patatin-like phospholipase family protein [Marinifilum caeruleilacunae]|uniref:Patatin-like phospholipase family protein n=1 Tax=Marinifilum caeruleilacunae TaxID=2499076 RepID=A0ABX1WQZ0_9BACT|nr:patatin-like phospholipase family protein [Marinifilum caeruleilacunae]NOU58358.1 patatin-like phospholipase family protein [Marinifilum caeruleilacunae]